MKNFKSTKKYAALSSAILAFVASGLNPALAADEIQVQGGSEGNLSTAVNSGTINAESQFDYVKYSAAVSIGYNWNRSIFAFAALTPDTGEFAGYSNLQAANYAYLVNNGIINLHYKDFVSQYADQLDTAGDSSKTYDNLFGWGVWAGEHSTIINNGVINFYYETIVRGRWI